MSNYSNGKFFEIKNKNGQELISISIDNGYDCIKIVVNGLTYKLESDVMKWEIKKVNSLGTSNAEEKNMYYKDEFNSYAVGYRARNIMQYNKTNEEVKKVEVLLKDEKRIVSEEFTIGCKTAIAYALRQYEKATGRKIDFKNVDLIIGLALPHGLVEDYRVNVASKLSGENHYEVYFGSEVVKYDYEIKKGAVVVVSQVEAGILGELYDCRGNAKAPQNTAITRFPTLALDGGYKTFGVAPIYDAEFTLYGDLTESNTNYAMLNVYEKMANDIKTKYGRKPTARELNELITINDVEYNVGNIDGKVQYINLLEEREKVIQNIAYEFVEYLKNLPNTEALQVFKSVFVFGGTGNAFYKYLKEKIGHQIGEDKVILAKAEIDGTDVAPVYAVAVGLYKVLIAEVRAEGAVFDVNA